MMGKSHIITGVCALENMYVATALITQSGIQPLIYVSDTLQGYFGFYDMTMFKGALCAVAYLFGCLLPDIDNPNSILGRFIHIPVKHRRWIHAIYLYLILAVLGLRNPVFGWMFFGVVVHLFWDSFSASGNCWLYKLLSDYRSYPNGAYVKKGHKLKLYHAGETSEYVLVALIVLVSVASYIWIVRAGYV